MTANHFKSYKLRDFTKSTVPCDRRRHHRHHGRDDDDDDDDDGAAQPYKVGFVGIESIWLGMLGDSGHPDCLGVQTGTRFKVETFPKPGLFRSKLETDVLASWLGGRDFESSRQPFQKPDIPTDTNSRIAL